MYLVEENPTMFPPHEFTSLPNLKVVDFDDLCSMKIAKPQYILQPVLKEKGLCMVYAPRGMGKTYVALSIAHTVASGGTLFSWECPSPVPVLYIDGEMPLHAIQERLIGIHLTAQKEVPETYLRICAADYQEDVFPNIATPEGQALIEPLLAGIKLVVIDNLSTLGRGKGRQNDEESWVPTQDWILSLRRRGISVLLVHHSGKNGDQRGTSAKEDVLDTVIQLKRPNDYTPAEGARFEVHFTKTRGFMGEEANPFEAKLVQDKNSIRWITQPLGNLRLEEIKDMLEAGATMREIASEMDMGLASVSRFCKNNNLGTRKRKN